MLCPRQGANCCYIDNVKLLQDLIKIPKGLGKGSNCECDCEYNSIYYMYLEYNKRLTPK